MDKDTETDGCGRRRNGAAVGALIWQPEPDRLLNRLVAPHVPGYADRESQI